jgi:iron complex transport system substrate-binding protein
MSNSRVLSPFRRIFAFTLSIALLIAGLASAAPSIAVAQGKNLTNGCVRGYRPGVDYFPEKVTLEDATGFKVEYFNHYKVVTVLNPWNNAKEQFKYVIVQCGTPAPRNIKDALVIEAPARRIIAMSTTHLPHLEKLGLLDRLIGMDEFTYVNNPKVRELIKAGRLIEIGSGPTVNIEKTIEARPDIVMTFGVGDPQFDSHPKLLEAKIPTVINAEYMEGTPLGRSEWIKFTALFFNREAAAQREYTLMKQRYLAVARKVSGVANRPLVLVGTASRGRWRMPGGASYFATLVRDAGGNYLMAANPSAGSVQISLEEAFDRAINADVWLLNAFQRYQKIGALLAEEPRYERLGPVSKGSIWNYDKRLNENGGNDYWETGVGNPHLILADLAKIFHPNLMADHELVFFRRIPER